MKTCNRKAYARLLDVVVCAQNAFIVMGSRRVRGAIVLGLMLLLHGTMLSSSITKYNN